MGVESSRGVCVFSKPFVLQRPKKIRYFFVSRILARRLVFKTMAGLGKQIPCVPPHASQKPQQPLETAKQPKKRWSVGTEDSFEAWIFGATFVFSLLRPRLWSKEVHGLRIVDPIRSPTDPTIDPTDQNVPEARWPNWCLRCRICPGHLPLDVSCRSRSRFFGRRNWCWQLTTYLNKKNNKKT